MQPRSLEQRVTALEQEILKLKDVASTAAALGSQFLQLREETRNEVSSIVRELKAADDETRLFMRILHEDALARIQVMGERDDANRSDR